MKRTIAALAATFALATSATAMVGPYERAVHNNEAGLFTQGTQAVNTTETQSDSPQAANSVGGEYRVTQFPSNNTDQHTQYGHEGR